MLSSLRDSDVSPGPRDRMCRYETVPPNAAPETGRRTTAGAYKTPTSAAKWKLRILVAVVVVVGAIWWLRRPDEPGASGKPVSATDGAARAEAAEPASAPVRRLTVKVLESFPHDREMYTQGLLWDEGVMLESGGEYGRSSLQRWRLGESAPIREQPLEKRFFAEGIARVGDRLLVLTWQENEILVHDPETLERLREIPFPRIGWGLCWDGREIFHSDGTSTLTVLDPQSLAELRRIEVRLEGHPVADLNELECAEGWIYANVFETDDILQIDPRSGNVVASIDATGLLAPTERIGTNVLNGIAYDPETETFLVTGKFWPKIFRVRFESLAENDRENDR